MRLQGLKDAPCAEPGCCIASCCGAPFGCTACWARKAVLEKYHNGVPDFVCCQVRASKTVLSDVLSIMSAWSPLCSRVSRCNVAGVPGRWLLLHHARIVFCYQRHAGWPLSRRLLLPRAFGLSLLGVHVAVVCFLRRIHVALHDNGSSVDCLHFSTWPVIP